MTSDASHFAKKNRHLSQALMLSGTFNIIVLMLVLYWVLRERPPTPYCELKPASYEQQQAPLVDVREGHDLLRQFSQLSFEQLTEHLSRPQLIENGYTERDLALACLVAWHHFDLYRALPKEVQPRQKRLLRWTSKEASTALSLTIYREISSEQFDRLIKFAQTERWPFTAQGLFLLLQKPTSSIDPHLVETFMLSNEFCTAEWLFSRFSQPVNKNELLAILLAGDWKMLKQFVDQQRQLHDQSEARRQKFLLDYVKVRSPLAALWLLKMDWEFAIKKLGDEQAIAVLKLLSPEWLEGKRFAREMLLSPRSTAVWQHASQWLYAQVGETVPLPWDYRQTLTRFIPEQLSEHEHLVRTAPLIASAGPLPQLYVVQEGDSLWKIGRKFSVKISILRDYNCLQSDVLRPGSTLKIPSA